jgi:anti-sigma factor RsiW
MSECTSGELRDLLPELVNGRLEARRQRMVEAHVASCTVCADELALLRSLRPALARGPVIDTRRIAAAVLAQTAGAAGRAPACKGVADRRRVAIAAAALLAAGALGYVAKTRGGSGSPEVAVAPAAESAHTPTAAAPRSAAPPAPVRLPQHEVAVVPPHATTTAPSAATSLASAGVIENLSDLSDDEVRALTASLDDISSIPNAGPSPDIDPLGASLDDPSAGGR